MSKFEEYQSVAVSLADCSLCGHDRADIIESGEVFHVECFACGERTGEHESYQFATKEWNEGVMKSLANVLEWALAIMFVVVMHALPWVLIALVFKWVLSW